MPVRRFPVDNRPCVPGAAVIAEKMEPGFARRTWSIPSLDDRTRCHLFLVAHGRAEFVADDGLGVELAAPLVVWLPRSARGEFHLAAGADGVAVAVAEDLVLRIVGDSPVAAHLRLLFDREVVAPPERVASQLDEIATLFGALEIRCGPSWTPR